VKKGKSEKAFPPFCVAVSWQLETGGWSFLDLAGLAQNNDSALANIETKYRSFASGRDGNFECHAG
jgi:hypothetical protein